MSSNSITDRYKEEAIKSGTDIAPITPDDMEQISKLAFDIVKQTGDHHSIIKYIIGFIIFYTDFNKELYNHHYPNYDIKKNFNTSKLSILRTLQQAEENIEEFLKDKLN